MILCVILFVKMKPLAVTHCGALFHFLAYLANFFTLIQRATHSIPKIGETCAYPSKEVENLTYHNQIIREFTAKISNENETTKQTTNFLGFISQAILFCHLTSLSHHSPSLPLVNCTKRF